MAELEEGGGGGGVGRVPPFFPTVYFSNVKQSYSDLAEVGELRLSQPVPHTKSAGVTMI